MIASEMNFYLPNYVHINLLHFTNTLDEAALTHFASVEYKVFFPTSPVQIIC